MTVYRLISVDVLPLVGTGKPVADTYPVLRYTVTQQVAEEILPWLLYG